MRKLRISQQTDYLLSVVLVLCTVGWSDLALFAIFENGHFAVYSIRYIFQFQKISHASQARRSNEFQNLQGP